MIHIFETKIPLYGIFFFGGMIIAAIIAFLRSKKEGVDGFDFIGAVIYVFIGAFIGAKLLFIIVSWQEIIRLKLTVLQVIQGGFVFYGGLLGGIVGLLIYAKQFKENFFKYADIFAIVLPLGHAFGRVGCLFAGCCYGIEYDGFGGIIYHSAVDVNTPIGISLLPIQGIESILLLALFLCLCILRKKVGSGKYVLSYASGYAFLRFVLEFLRGDIERGVVLGISTSQWISIGILVVVSIVMFCNLRKKH